MIVFDDVEFALGVMEERIPHELRYSRVVARSLARGGAELGISKRQVKAIIDSYFTHSYFDPEMAGLYIERYYGQQPVRPMEIPIYREEIDWCMQIRERREGALARGEKWVQKERQLSLGILFTLRHLQTERLRMSFREACIISGIPKTFLKNFSRTTTKLSKEIGINRHGEDGKNKPSFYIKNWMSRNVKDMAFTHIYTGDSYFYAGREYAGNIGEIARKAQDFLESEKKHTEETCKSNPTL